MNRYPIKQLVIFVGLAQIYIGLEIYEIITWPVLIAIGLASFSLSRRLYGKTITPISVFINIWVLSMAGADMVPFLTDGAMPEISIRWPLWIAVEALCFFTVLFTVTSRIRTTSARSVTASNEKFWFLQCVILSAAYLAFIIYLRLKAGIGIVGVNVGEVNAIGTAAGSAAVILTMLTIIPMALYAYLVTFKLTWRSYILGCALIVLLGVSLSDRRELTLIPLIGIVIDMASRGLKTAWIGAIIGLFSVGLFVQTQSLMGKEFESGKLLTATAYFTENWNAYALAVDKYFLPGELGGKKTLIIPRAIIRTGFGVNLDRLPDDWELVGRLEELGGYNTAPVILTFYRDFGYMAMFVGMAVLGCVMGVLYSAGQTQGLGASFITVWLIAQSFQSIRSTSLLEHETFVVILLFGGAWIYDEITKKVDMGHKTNKIQVNPNNEHSGKAKAPSIVPGKYIT